MELTITFCKMIDATKIGSNLEIVPNCRQISLISMRQNSKLPRKLTL